MSARLLLSAFDGTMLRLEVLPAREETRVQLSMQYWDSNDRRVSGKLEFYGVAAIGFSVNYHGQSIGSELCGLYELTDKAEKVEMLRENFDRRRRDFLLTGYAFDENDPHDLLNDTSPLERIRLADLHLYEQQTEGGVYRILAKGWKLEEP